MKNSVSKVGLLVVIVLVLGLYVISSYNSMINLEENVTTMQANIQTALQSRLDKINQLMPSVQGYLNHEEDAFVSVTALRSGTPGVKVDSNGNIYLEDNLNAEELEVIDSATSSLISELRVSVEAYPELQSSGLMSDFMTAIEGSENRLKVARDRYNEAVQEYNKGIRKFPKNIVAVVMGFEKLDKFSASYDAQSAPIVSFE